MELKNKDVGKVKKVPLKPTPFCKRMIFYRGGFRPIIERWPHILSVRAVLLKKHNCNIINFRLKNSSFLRALGCHTL